MKPITILSLFDGISGGQVALERIGIPVEKYYASEIDKFAIQVTQKNYPNTIQIGDVEKIDFKQFEGKIDLLIGGSPCTNLSICGNRKGLEGDESRLFWEFVRAIKECKPKYFFLENVESMSDKDKEIISQALGCYPIMINSSLVSAQNRRRYYWFNWGDKQYNLFGMPTCDIPQPKDKKIVLKDILENEYAIICLNCGKTLTKAVDKSVALCARDYKGFRNIQESTRVLEPICVNVPELVKVRKYEVDIDNLKKILKEHKTLSNKDIAKNLNYPISTVEHWFRNDNSFSIPPSEIWFKLKELLNIETDVFDKSIVEFEERLSNYDKSSRKYFVYGKMSTLTCGNNDEIIEPLTPYVEKQYEKYNKKHNEIPEMFNPYNCLKIEDKAPTLTTSSGRQSSSSTVMLFEPCIYQLPHGYNKGSIIKDKAPTMTVSSWEHNNKVCVPVQIGNIGSNAQAYRVYSIRGKSVTLNANSGGQGGKTGLYKIDLPDGDYIIRKLSPLECERLQTLDDGYTEGIYNSQRYKCIGNGWTIDVIAHIFKFLKEVL